MRFVQVVDNESLLQVECPVCGTELQGFQTKGGDCSSLDWRVLQSFWKTCPSCKTWVDCFVENDGETLRIYAKPTQKGGVRTLVREESWTLKGMTAFDWAQRIQQRGAEGVYDLLREQIASQRGHN